MTEIAQVFPDETEPLPVAAPAEPPNQAPEPTAPPRPLLDCTAPLLCLFLAVGLVVFVAAFRTVHARSPEALAHDSGAIRTNFRMMRWITRGYFDYFGLLPQQ